jgi:hypothetical protein
MVESQTQQVTEAMAEMTINTKSAEHRTVTDSTQKEEKKETPAGTPDKTKKEGKNDGKNDKSKSYGPEGKPNPAF